MTSLRVQAVFTMAESQLICASLSLDLTSGRDNDVVATRDRFNPITSDYLADDQVVRLHDADAAILLTYDLGAGDISTALDSLSRRARDAERGKTWPGDRLPGTHIATAMHHLQELL